MNNHESLGNRKNKSSNSNVINNNRIKIPTIIILRTIIPIGIYKKMQDITVLNSKSIPNNSLSKRLS